MLFACPAPQLLSVAAPGPEVVVLANAYNHVRFRFVNRNRYTHVWFGVEGWVNGRWTLLDNDLNCRQLNATYIFSCSPVRVKAVTELRFRLDECEMLPSRIRTLRADSLQIRIIAEPYAKSPVRFQPFFIYKNSKSVQSVQKK